MKDRHQSGNFEGRHVAMKASMYLQRIYRYSGVSPSCFIAALVYLERYKNRYPFVLLTSRTLQRLLLVPTMLAAKYLDDKFCSNRCW